MGRWCVLYASLVVLGCGQPPPVGGACASGAACSAPLVCVLSACRAACGALGECGPGSTCVADAEGRTACTLPGEEACGRGGGCPSPLLCVADRCRAPCRESEPRCAPGSACTASGAIEICAPLLLDGGTPVDGGPSTDAGSPPDVGHGDGAALDAPRLPELPFCATTGCETADECFLGACEAETVRRIGADWAPVSGLPDGAPFHEVPAFVDGTCVTQTRAPLDSPEACDWFINAPSSECGACARCVVEFDPSNGGLGTVCRDRCDPGNPASCRAGYACDPITRTCQDACVDDVQCRIYWVDSNDDGFADRYEYDPTSEAFCNARGLCEEGGSAPVLAGAGCERHSDCGPGGLCLGPSLLQDANRSSECFELQCNVFSGGYCTHTGCGAPGLECADGEICTRALELFGGTTELCLRACEMGAEPESDRTGVMGHGLGCRPGYRCRYPSDAVPPSPGEPAMGGCTFGFYTDVTEPNVGAPCSANEECWSPFGAAICSALGFGAGTVSNACILDNCDAPGLPADFCGPDAACVDFGDNAFCLRNCTSAEECAPGWGCLALGASASSRVCISNCITSGDCRDGEGCYRADAISIGTCVAGGTCGSPVDLAAQASVQPDGSLRLIGSLGSEIHYGCGGGLPGTALLYVPPADGVLLADAGGPMADGVILLRARGDCAGLSADLACGLEGPSPSAIGLRVEGGRPYYLIVDAGSPTTTTFDLGVRFIEVLRPGERCDVAADACPDGFACVASPAGDTICQVPDLGCGPGVPVAAETSLAPGADFGAPIDGTLPTGSVPRLSGSCAMSAAGQREVVHPLVSPIDGVLTLVALANFDVSLSVRTECRTASSELNCAAYDLGIAPPLPADLVAAPAATWLAYVPARLNVEVRAGEPLHAIVEGAAPGGAYRLLARVLPFREIGEACDPLRQTDLCRRGALCDGSSSTCVVRDEGCGPGIPVVELTSRVPPGDDVRFVHSGTRPILQAFQCPAVPLPFADTWHHVTLPGTAADHWNYEVRGAMGYAAVVRATSSCGPVLGPQRCARGNVTSNRGPLSGGDDLFFSVLAGPGAGPTYEVEAHLWRVSIDACGGAGDLPCARGLSCHGGVCTPVTCGDGVAEGGEFCDSSPLCDPSCGSLIVDAGAGAASCAGVAMAPLSLVDSDPGLVAYGNTSTLGDVPSVPTSCGGSVPARHYSLTVPVRGVLTAEATAFVGPVAVSVRTACADPMTELACDLSSDPFSHAVTLGTLDPGDYVVSVQFPAAGIDGTQGFLLVRLTPE